MNYSQIRKKLIILLFFTNLFLGFNYFRMKVDDHEIIAQKQTNQIQILQNLGINLHEDLLDENIYNVKKMTCNFVGSDNIKQILGSDVVIENDIYISEIGYAQIDEFFNFYILLNDVFDSNDINQLLFDSGFDILNAVVFFEGEKMIYQYKFEEKTVLDIQFEVIITDRKAQISGNFIASNDSEFTDVNVDVFDIILKNFQSKNISGDILGIETTYQMTYKSASKNECEISPFLDFYFDDFYLSFNILENTYQFIKKI